MIEENEIDINFKNEKIDFEDNLQNSTPVFMSDKLIK